MDPMVFQFIGETVTNATDAFVTPAATNLMVALQILALSGVTLYIILTGYAIMTGAVQSPFWTFAKQCIKMIIIAFFALTVDGYIGGVMSALQGLESGLSDALNTTGSPALSIYQTIDQSMGRGFELVAVCFENADKAGWNIGSAFGWLIAGLIVAIGTVLVAIIGGAVVIVAKFSLAIAFALGPLFVLSLMFPATVKFFDSWFSQVINYTLTIIIVAVIMTFAMASYDAFIAGADLSGDGNDNPAFASLQIGALTGVLMWILKRATTMASGFAGGLAMEAMGIRHMLMPATKTAKAATTAGNMINPYTTRRDLQSGMMVTARRGNHLIAGNTMVNPAYRQHVMENIGKNWGKKKGGSATEK